MDIGTRPIGHMPVFDARPLSSDRATSYMVIWYLFFNGARKYLSRTIWPPVSKRCRPLVQAEHKFRAAPDRRAKDPFYQQPRAVGQPRDCDAVPGSAESAKRISAESECEPVFFMTAARWFSTVRWLMPRSAAMFLLGWPATPSSMIWRWRAVRPARRVAAASRRTDNLAESRVCSRARSMLANSSPRPIGFSMKSAAPAFMASTAIGTSPWPVIMIAGRRFP